MSRWHASETGSSVTAIDDALLLAGEILDGPAHRSSGAIQT